MAKQKKIEYAAIDIKDVQAGQIVRVHQKIKDVNAKGEEKERVQIFEGLVLARKHGSEPGSTFIVRKVSEGVGVEKTFPVFSPLIEKIEVVDTKISNRSKLYFTRDYKKRLKSVGEKTKTYQKGETPKAPAAKKAKKKESAA